MPGKAAKVRLSEKQMDILRKISREATASDQFLEWFPGVSRADVESVLNHEVSLLTKSDAA